MQIHYVKTDILRILLSLMAALTASQICRCEHSGPTVSELCQMCSDALKKRDYHKTQDLALHLMKTSVQEKQEPGIGTAYYYLGATEVYLGMPDSALKHLNEALRIAETLRNDSLTGLTLNCLGMYEATANLNYHVAQYYFMRSLDYPSSANSASINLAQIALLQNDMSGIEYAKRTYEHGKKTGDIHSCYISMLSLIKFAMLDEDYDSATRLLWQMQETAEKHGYTDLDRLKLLEAELLSKTGHIPESDSLLDSIYPAIEAKHPNHLPTLIYLKGENLRKEKRYAASNNSLSEAIKVSEKVSSTTSLVKTYRLIADNYSSMGLDSQALPYMRKAFDLSEKSTQTDKERMINERKLILDIIHKEQKQQLAEEKARYNGRLSIFLGLLLFLAGVTITIIIINLRRRNRLYRHIVQQNVAMLENEEKYLESEEKYKEQIRKLESQLEYEPKPGAVQVATQAFTDKDSDTETQTSRETEDGRRQGNSNLMAKEKSKRLFESLQTLMEGDKLYRNPQLTRETVMELLKTNSTYLGQAIKDNTGMNYSQYVNSFRMREALKALSDRTRIEVPIKDIAMEAGFNSLTTFYKLFQQTTGISPTAYRRSLADMAQTP